MVEEDVREDAVQPPRNALKHFLRLLGRGRASLGEPPVAVEHGGGAFKGVGDVVYRAALQSSHPTHAHKPA